MPHGNGAHETAGRMLRALVSGDAFFSDAFLSGDDMSAAAAAAEFGKDATLAGLLEEHAGVAGRRERVRGGRARDERGGGKPLGRANRKKRARVGNAFFF